MVIEKSEQGQINSREIDFRVFMAETVVYREEQYKRMEELSHDVKDIKTILSKLPCEKGAMRYDSLAKQVAAVWVFITAALTKIIYDWIAK